MSAHGARLTSLAFVLTLLGPMGAAPVEATAHTASPDDRDFPEAAVAAQATAPAADLGPRGSAVLLGQGLGSSDRTFVDSLNPLTTFPGAWNPTPAITTLALPEAVQLAPSVEISMPILQARHNLPEIPASIPTTATYVACAQLRDGSTVCSPIPIPLGVPTLLNVDGDLATGVAGADLRVSLSPVESVPRGVPEGLLDALRDSVTDLASNQSAYLTVERLSSLVPEALAPLPAHAFVLWGLGLPNATAPSTSDKVLVIEVDGTASTLPNETTLVARVNRMALDQGSAEGTLDVKFEGPGSNVRIGAIVTDLGRFNAPGDTLGFSAEFAPVPQFTIAFDAALDGHDISLQFTADRSSLATLTFSQTTPEQQVRAEVEVALLPSQFALRIVSAREGEVSTHYDASALIDRLRVQYNKATSQEDLRLDATLLSVPASLDLDATFQRDGAGTSRLTLESSASSTLPHAEAGLQLSKSGNTTSARLAMDNVPREVAVGASSAPSSTELTYSASSTAGPVSFDLTSGDGRPATSMVVAAVPRYISAKLSTEEFLMDARLDPSDAPGSDSLLGLAIKHASDGQFFAGVPEEDHLWYTAVGPVARFDLVFDGLRLVTARLKDDVSAGSATQCESKKVHLVSTHARPFAFRLENDNLTAQLRLLNLPQELWLDASDAGFSYGGNGERMAVLIGSLATKENPITQVALEASGIPDAFCLMLDEDGKGLSYVASSALHRLHLRGRVPTPLDGILSIDVELTQIPAAWDLDFRTDGMGFNALGGALGTLRLEVSNAPFSLATDCLAATTRLCATLDVFERDYAFSVAIAGLRDVHLNKGGGGYEFVLNSAGAAQLVVALSALLEPHKLLTVAGTVSPLPSDIKAEVGDAIQVTTSEHYDLHVSAALGHPDSIANTPDPPWQVLGFSVRDGISPAGGPQNPAYRANVSLTGLPARPITIGLREKSFDMSDWRPATPDLVIDIVHEHAKPGRDAQVALVGGPMVTGRHGAALAWNGESAYLFGGTSDGGRLDEILRFDNDTAGQVSRLARLPTPLTKASAVWAEGARPAGEEGPPRNLVYVFGGESASGPSDAILMYDPLADVLSRVGSLPSPRSATSAVWDRGAAYIFGGFGTVHLDEIIRFVPGTGEVAVVGYLPSSRSEMAAAWLGNDAFLFGGMSPAGPLNETLKFSPASGLVKVMKDPLPRTMAAATAAVYRSDVFISGGYGGANAERLVRFHVSTESGKAEFDGALPSARRWGASLVSEDTLWFIGGFDGVNRKELLRLDLGTPGSPFQLEATSLAPLGDGTSSIWDGSHFYVFGGGVSGYHNEIVRVDADGRNPKVVNAKLPQAVASTSAVWTGKHAFIFGGFPFSDKIVRYDPLTDSTTLMGARLPGHRGESAAVWDGKYAYVLGGSDGRAYLDQIVRYDPESDTVQVLGAKLLSPTGALSAVWTGKEAYLFGGYDTGPSDKVVRYVPASASMTVVATLPTSRYGTAAVWMDGTAYLMGGIAAGRVTDEIIAFHPVDVGSPSVERLEARLPVPLLYHSAAAGEAGALTFGGYGDAARDRIQRFLPEGAPIAAKLNVKALQVTGGAETQDLNGELVTAELGGQQVTKVSFTARNPVTFLDVWAQHNQFVTALKVNSLKTVRAEFVKTSQGSRFEGESDASSAALRLLNPDLELSVANLPLKGVSGVLTRDGTGAMSGDLRLVERSDLGVIFKSRDMDAGVQAFGLSQLSFSFLGEGLEKTLEFDHDSDSLGGTIDLHFDREHKGERQGKFTFSRLAKDVTIGLTQKADGKGLARLTAAVKDAPVQGSDIAYVATFDDVRIDLDLTRVAQADFTVDIAQDSANGLISFDQSQGTLRFLVEGTGSPTWHVDIDGHGLQVADFQVKDWSFSLDVMNPDLAIDYIRLSPALNDCGVLYCSRLGADFRFGVVLLAATGVGAFSPGRFVLHPPFPQPVTFYPPGCFVDPDCGFGGVLPGDVTVPEGHCLDWIYPAGVKSLKLCS